MISTAFQSREKAILLQGLLVTCWVRRLRSPPVVPFYPFFGEGSPAKINYRKKGTWFLRSLGCLLVPLNQHAILGPTILKQTLVQGNGTGSNKEEALQCKVRSIQTMVQGGHEMGCVCVCVSLEANDTEHVFGVRFL